MSFLKARTKNQELPQLLFEFSLLFLSTKSYSVFSHFDWILCKERHFSLLDSSKNFILYWCLLLVFTSNIRLNVQRLWLYPSKPLIRCSIQIISEQQNIQTIKFSAKQKMHSTFFFSLIYISNYLYNQTTIFRFI